MGALSAPVPANEAVLEEDPHPYYTSPDYDDVVVPEEENPLDLIASIRDAIVAERPTA